MLSVTWGRSFYEIQGWFANSSGLYFSELSPINKLQFMIGNVFCLINNDMGDHLHTTCKSFLRKIVTIRSEQLSDINISSNHMLQSYIIFMFLYAFVIVLKYKYDWLIDWLIFGV